MLTVRQPAVADRFYPGDAHELTQLLDNFLAGAAQRSAPHVPPVRISPPKALIVPHAGYLYSGAIAATAYATLIPARNAIARAVVLGPSHRVPLRGLAASRADCFATPLGAVFLDRAAIAQALALPQVQLMDEAHALEHSLEVQLPFLQRVLARFALVPLAVGDASPEAVAEVLELLWGGSETLIVISSDLSHYQDYATARRLDAATSAAIEALRPDDISDEQACGCNPINGLLTVAKRHGLRARTLDLRNSGDTAGTRERVVGYGAYVFH